MEEDAGLPHFSFMLRFSTGYTGLMRKKKIANLDPGEEVKNQIGERISNLT